jgi:hypothetical protein
VRYQSGAAFRTALEQRLLTRSRTTGLALARLRKHVAFERLLARLLVVAPDRWVLKGGLALDFRLGARARATVDMDLGRHDDDTAASRDFAAARLADLETTSASRLRGRSCSMMPMLLVPSATVCGPRWQDGALRTS